jgi:hypothetical protein
MTTKRISGNPIRMLMGGSFKTGKYVVKSETLLRLVTNLVSPSDNYSCDNVQFRLVKSVRNDAQFRLINIGKK